MGLKIVNLKIHSPICKEALWKWKREALVHAKHLVPVNFQVLDVECAWCNEWPHQSTMWVASSNWGVRKPPQFLTKIKHFSEVSGVPNFEMHPCKACRRFRDTATRFIKKVGLSKPANHIKKSLLKVDFFFRIFNLKDCMCPSVSFESATTSRWVRSWLEMMEWSGEFIWARISK